MEVSSEFQSELLDVKQLAAYPHLESLMLMVNEAYHVRHREIFETENRGRFGDVQEVVESLDSVGRFCIITQSQENQASRIVACSLLKAFHEGDPVSSPLPRNTDSTDISLPNGANGTKKLPKSSVSEPGLTSDFPNAKHVDPDVDIRSISEWELGVVVVRPDPQLSKLGLAVRCASLLEQDLLERLERTEKEDDNGRTAPVGQQQPLTFWLKTTEEINGSYWRRRGYTTVRTKIFPKGFWGAYRDFELAWMKKCIPRRAVSGSS
ncbi:hypothetical protein AJ78_06302 [Emergomyces pasteurianus Ep9510]|uniref:N-acetyltransferase domain-containing protein n=1 Tax=Emergomyces pasteurianus Ep9510 TaxID=1447872 RepID=A0A1J9PB73_9EURO|nr:hypothetical protein AJ78_07696 [Emergomyces pasteurianus Ep9510]OJD13210.1 hypothetical protein AJ78_06302 [Emergomyces pasteurianus Ep9510]